MAKRIYTHMVLETTDTHEHVLLAAHESKEALAEHFGVEFRKTWSVDDILQEARKNPMLTSLMEITTAEFKSGSGLSPAGRKLTNVSVEFDKPLVKA